MGPEERPAVRGERGRMRRSGAVAALVAVVLAAGCGGAEPDADPAGGDLEAALGLTDPETTARLFQDRQMDVQEAVRDCMVAEGFEYVPYVGDTSVFGVLADQGLTDREYAATYGYGLSTVVDDILGADVFDREDDPNLDIYESLGDAEREAYDLTLYGPEGEEGPGAGCFGTSLETVFGGSGPFELFNELGEKTAELQERIDRDPRVIAANLEWSACMAGEGYDHDTPGEAEAYVQGRVQALILPALLGAVGGDAPVAAPEGPRPGALGRLADVFGDVPYDEAELAAIQEEEIALAVADYECRAPLTAVYAEVEQEYEAEFVTENRDLIDRLTGGGV